MTTDTQHCSTRNVYGIMHVIDHIVCPVKYITHAHLDLVTSYPLPVRHLIFCYVFTATKLFDACGLELGDWLADRCSAFIEFVDFTELGSRTMTSVVLTISANDRKTHVIIVTRAYNRILL